MSKHTDNTSNTTIKQAINEFLLSCKVEGKSYGTIECYSDNLKGFLRYATNYDWPDDISAITTNNLREFLAYLRETPHRFNSTCPRAKKPINSTTVQKYYRALSALFNWSLVVVNDTERRIQGRIGCELLDHPIFLDHDSS